MIEMTTNDEIIKKNADLIDYEDYDEMCRRFDVMLNEARADAAKKERERILKSGEYVSRSFMKLEIKQARADERQRCVEKLYDIDGETEAESLWFMEHVLERIRKKEDARAKFGGSKELPPRDMIWEGINYYKEQAIAKLSKR